MFCRIKRIGSPAGRCGSDRRCGHRRDIRGGRRQVCPGASRRPRAAARSQRLEPGFIVFLHALERRLELLIAELCLLDHAGELPHLIFELVDPHQEVAGRLRVRGNATGYDGDGRYGGNSETGH